MKSLLIAMSVVSMFAACKSNPKTDQEMAGRSATVGLSDGAASKPLPKGTNRVTVVETHHANGSSTVTTTTDINSKPNTVATKPVVSPQPTVIAQPTVSTAPVITPEADKKGWSTRAKGAAIGGVGGAAAGAIISKNKVAGAVLGGAVGAGGGYIIGNEIDRKKAKP